MSDPVAEGYDAVYSTMLSSPTLLRLWREHACGLDFPEDFAHISFVTVDELTRIADELRVGADNTFVDLASGLGGPALWLARHTGAHVIGVDLSSMAVLRATERAARLGFGQRATFVQGTFAHTGLDGGMAAAVVSEDALQYAPDKLAACVEAARVLRRGGRFVFTAFELDASVVAGLPVLGVDAIEDYRVPLERAGFTVNTYEEIRGWPQPVTVAYQSLMDARSELVLEMGEPAVNALLSEVALTLQLKPYRRRVLVCSTKS